LRPRHAAPTLSIRTRSGPQQDLPRGHGLRSREGVSALRQRAWTPAALVVLLFGSSAALAQLPPTQTPGQQFQLPPSTPMPPAPVPEPAPTGLQRWFNPSTAPFIPVPVVGTDPDSGTTVGIMPVWVRANPQLEIDRIIAPDLVHNPYFGWGMHARLYAYPSEDEHWSAVAGIKQRVERELDLDYQIGLARRGRWSFAAGAVYARDGTPRFYGIGNQTSLADQTNYTAEQEVLRARIGYNISRIWQLAYTVRLRRVDVQPGTLSGIPSIEQRFGAQSLGSDREFLHRLGLVYDTRDDLTIPHRGMQWIAYVGMASRTGLFNDSMYTDTGVDARAFWPVFHDTVFAAHVAVRYLLRANDVPFWALSSVGGDRSAIGGEQPLRGFGFGRYVDRNSFATTLELRHRVFSFNAVSTHVDIELTPFVDAGRVFADTDTFPLDHLHTVGGIGFRGVARPFVVGYVDVGYGTEGVAVFTGINYPF